MEGRKGGRPLRLAGDARFERYGQSVYLRTIGSRKDYLFNAVSYDVLCCFDSGAARTREDVFAALSEQFEVKDMAAFHREVGDSLDTLEREGILVPDTVPEPAPGSVQEQVTQACIRERRLFSAALELTYRCNERCLHCYVDGPGRETNAGELTLDEYKALLDELRAMGCISLLLTGGEVCVKETFLPIAQYAASLGMLVDIFTNGIGLTPELFDALQALRPNSISYSLYGGSARVHDAITQVDGSFDRTLRAVMMTKCAGIDTYIKTVVMKQNLDSLEELLQWGRRLDIPVTAGFAVLDTHTGRSAAPYQIDDPAQFRRAVNLLQRYQPGPPARRGREPDSRVCSAGLCSLSIDPRGEVRPCMTLPSRLGNVREMPISQIWETAPALDTLRDTTMADVCGRCVSCESFDFCELCLGRVNAGGGVPRDVCLLARAVADGQTM